MKELFNPNNSDPIGLDKHERIMKFIEANKVKPEPLQPRRPVIRSRLGERNQELFNEYRENLRLNTLEPPKGFPSIAALLLR